MDINELCAAAFDESRYRCEREGIDMKLDLADGLARVNGHAGQLLSALSNVMRNSREAYARDAAATDSRDDQDIDAHGRRQRRHPHR